MNLRVIEGGRGTVQAVAQPDLLSPSIADVRREEQRRLRVLNYDRWVNRERMTGIAIPRETRYLAMQITFVADALSALPAIPTDFRSDCYWPM